MLYGSNAERLDSAPGTFNNHCLTYSGLYLIGNCFFGRNCIAPWFSYPSRTAIRQKFNLEARYAISAIFTFSFCSACLRVMRPSFAFTFHGCIGHVLLVVSTWSWELRDGRVFIMKHDASVIILSIQRIRLDLSRRSTELWVLRNLCPSLDCWRCSFNIPRLQIMSVNNSWLLQDPLWSFLFYMFVV